MTGRRRVVRRVPSRPRAQPSVTVVVPSYNYGRYLTACASSVLAQRDVELSLVILDDCSSDDTPAVTAELASRDARVTIVRNESNRGMIPSVNEGLGLVESRYVVKLDADDLLSPGSLARATALLETHPEVSFVYGRPQHFTGPEPHRSEHPARSWTLWAGHEWVARRCRTGNNAISQPEAVIRTSMLRRVGPVRADLPHTSDLNLWLRLASIGDVGRINGPAQGYYRVHNDSLQRTVHTGDLFRLRGRRDAFAAAFAVEAGRLEDAAALWRTARRALAADALDRAAHAYDRGRVGSEGESIEDFVDFAAELWPDARGLPEYRALTRRREIGERRAHRYPPFVAHALARRARAEVRRWNWQRTGEM